MAGKLKLDPKKLAVDHGEKLAFGVIVVLVLLALVSTNWVPYEKEPEEITTKVAEAQSKLGQSGWPQEEQTKYQLTPEKQPREVVVAQLETPVLVTPLFAPSQKMTKPLNELDNPLQEPELNPVKHMYVTQARVFVHERTEPEELANAGEGDEGTSSGESGKPGASDKKDENVSDEFRSRGGLAGGGAVPGGYGAGDSASMLGMAMGGYQPDYGSMEAPELAMGETYGAGYYSGMMGGMPGEEGMEGGMGFASNIKGRGYPFVSVRGVFEFKEQVRKFAEAIHRSPAEAYRTFEIIDFELQRQVLEVSPDQWSDWSKVDTNVLRDVIKTAAGLAPDPVQPTVTDSAITCPLPQRVFGVWDQQATHPLLKDFQLSEAEMDNELKYQYALLKSFMESKKSLPETGVQKKGFSDMQFDARQLQQGVMGLDSAYDMQMSAMSMMQGEAGMGAGMAAMAGGYPGGGIAGYGGGPQGSTMGGDAAFKKFAEELTKELDPKEVDEQLRDYIKKRAQAAGSLLLFRYLDFNVVPGRTYRYRVRLELRNPNYGQNIASAGGVAQVVDGPTRPTPWSEVTEPITVEDTVKYYISKIEPARVRLYPEVRMNVFQYDQTLGTWVQQQLNVAYGQNVGGKAKAKQVDPAKQTNEEKDYVFKSNDVVVDSMPDISFNSAAHPDLKLAPNSRSQAGISEHALLVTQDHRLKDVDPLSQADALAKMEKYMEDQDEFFESMIRQQPTDLGEGMTDYSEMYEQLYGGAMGMGDSSAGAGGGRRARGRSPLRKGGSYGAGMMPGMMPGMGPGMGPGKGRKPARGRPSQSES
jgi:hypothetical protein